MGLWFRVGVNGSGPGVQASSAVSRCDAQALPSDCPAEVLQQGSHKSASFRSTGLVKVSRQENYDLTCRSCFAYACACLYIYIYIHIYILI